MSSYSKNEAQDWAWENLRGQWTTIPTSFTQHDTIDEEALRHNIRHIRSLGTSGAGCTWGMGEFWSLTREERMTVMEVVATEANAKWPIAAHVSHTSSRETLSLINHAEGLGFDLLIVAAPYMMTKTENQVISWVQQLAAETNLGIMFYNSPQFGIVMSPQGLKRICDIPNVVGVKEASFSQQISIETHLLAGTQAIISTPDEWIFAKGKELGFQQQVIFANTSDWRFDLPGSNHYVQYIDRATRGELDQEFYNVHLKAIKSLSDKWWGTTMKNSGGALPVPMVKAWGELMGMQMGHVRSPLVNLSMNERDELAQELAALRPILEKSHAAPNGHSKHSGTLNNGISLATSQPRPDRLEDKSSKSSTSGMMLMVSVQNVEEALEAEKGGADVVDVKNLQEALVGSGHPLLVEQLRGMIPQEKHVSVTLGVVPSQPGTVAMAVYAAAKLEATSVKVGFVNTDYDTAVEVLQESRAALKGSDTKLIGSVFADNHLYDGLDPQRMVNLARDGQCDGWLIDTLTKDGRNLFDFIPEPKLREMVLEGKSLGMSTALSGHLRMDNINKLARINPDIVGVRGAVCATGDRTRSVAWEAVAAFKHEIGLRKSGTVDPRVEPEEPANGYVTGWTVIDGRGKNCAGVIAALTEQVQHDNSSFIEAVLADALNIYDLMEWAMTAGHKIITHRKDQDGTVRLLI
ncbi:dihydrodipicolinate synthase family protein, partial [Dehalococcoidia bacterium]|nr:dihydrodipicolinate synthase family protein [Dehalococcoidia bacterium]